MGCIKKEERKEIKRNFKRRKEKFIRENSKNINRGVILLGKYIS